MSEDSRHPLDDKRRQGRMIIRAVRWGFFILITTVALVTVIQRAADQGSDQPAFAVPRAGSTPAAPITSPAPATTRPIGTEVRAEVEIPWWAPVAIALVLFGVVVLIDLATPNKKISSISGVMFGLLAGILATVALSAVIELALQVWLPPKALDAIRPLISLIKPLLGVALCYLGITTILQTQDDFRLVIPYVEFAKQIRGTKPLVLDTSALIDARIADIAATGLLQAPLLIPKFVVTELQTLSDSTDRLKRARGRRGLDIVTRLQRQGTIDVTIDETPTTALSVDQMIVELARRMEGRIVTTDSGLSRVAQIQGVLVLNMHEIAAALKPALVPGEQITIRLVKPGEQAGQAVGYLDDGTMVVTEHAAPLIGQDAPVIVTSAIQTAAGRMVFAKPALAANVSESAPERPAGSPLADADPPSASSPEWTVADEPGDARPEAASVAETRADSEGPFPPKPPPRRPPSGRNPRR